MYSESLFNTNNKTQIIKKFPSDKINITKMYPFFLLRAPTHYSFTFNSRFLYELKHKVHISKSVGFSIFHSVSFLLKVICLFNKKHVTFDFKTPLYLSKLK